MNTQLLTYTIPHILLDYKNQDGRSVFTVRQGGSVQLEHTVSVDFVEDPVDERDQLFVIKAKNQINFGGSRIEVLNNKITGDLSIAPSSPTAEEYMANVGKKVLIAFECHKSESHSREQKKDIFKVIRSTIVLP